jgi:hypothetical protein
MSEPTAKSMPVALADAIVAILPGIMPVTVTAARRSAVKQGQNLENTGDTPDFEVLTFPGGKGEVTSGTTFTWEIGIRIVLQRRVSPAGQSDPDQDAKSATCELLQQIAREWFVTHDIQFDNDGQRLAGLVAVDFEQQYVVDHVVTLGVWQGGQTLTFKVAK